LLCNSAFTLASAQYVSVLAVTSGASQQAERTIVAHLLVSAILCVGTPSPSLCLRDDVSVFAIVFVGYDPSVSRFRSRLQGKKRFM
jgi:hypothetical protein